MKKLSAGEEVISGRLSVSVSVSELIILATDNWQLLGNCFRLIWAAQCWREPATPRRG
jgi:hypothetical protein